MREFWSSRPFFRKVTLVAATLLCLFHIYTAIFGTFEALRQRSIHLGLGLIIVYLLYGSKTREDGTRSPKWQDWLLLSLATASIVYVQVAYEWLTVERFTFISPVFWYEKFFAVSLIVTVLIGCGRVVSKGLLYSVIGFLAYPFFGPYLPGPVHAAPIGINDLLDFYYLSLGGIFGIPLGVSSTEIALFIIFGYVVLRTGGTFLINNIASAVAWRLTGGAAKIAIVGSSLFGCITGSTSGNVAAVGSVTIPLMKKAGYRPVFAAAVEAAASCGGQMVPPVMGAAAFVMAGFSGIPYSKLMGYALFPGILYYFSLFSAVHLEAKRFKLAPIRPDMSVRDSLLDYGHMLIPVGILIYLLVAGYTPRLAGGYGIVTALIASQLRKKTRLTLTQILSAFEDGAKGILIVMISTASAGLIVGTVEVTGFGQRISSAFVNITGGNLFLGLVTGAVIAFLLGLGMPTTPSYILLASTVIPALISLGLANYAAHLFAFYYACLALITPPDATAAFTAAAI
ncbi:MAG: TRAP transporter fused permease subunit, partial [Syntrophorhabdales bacterium]